MMSMILHAYIVGDHTCSNELLLPKGVTN